MTERARSAEASAGASDTLRAPREIVSGLGASAAETEEVLEYCANPFVSGVASARPLPLPDEPHVEDWGRYERESGGRPFEYLQERLPQLNVPIAQGTSKTDAYAAVARRGEPFREPDFGGRLALRSPGRFRFYLHRHAAGALPVLETDERCDFETLWRALACRSEPQPLPPGVKAQLVGGFINWERVARYRSAWLLREQPASPDDAWRAERQRVAASERERFYDRMMLVERAPYGGVRADALGLRMDEADWLRLSMSLRLEHEFTHYATKRLFGVMRLNLLDEIVADYLGITHALDDFKSSWFLRFMGLERWPGVDPGGRVHAYRQGLSEGAFRAVLALTIAAAQGLERIHERARSRPRGETLLALVQLTLEQLAAPDALERFQAARARVALPDAV